MMKFRHVSQSSLHILLNRYLLGILLTVFMLLLVNDAVVNTQATILHEGIRELIYCRILRVYYSTSATPPDRAPSLSYR